MALSHELVLLAKNARESRLIWIASSLIQIGEGVMALVVLWRFRSEL